MYITLSADLKYPNNNHSCFYYELTEPLELHDLYEVALTEFSYAVDYEVKYGTLFVQKPIYFLEKNKDAEAIINERGKFSKEQEDGFIKKHIDLLLADITSRETLLKQKYDEIPSANNVKKDQLFVELDYEYQNYYANLESIVEISKTFTLNSNEMRPIIDFKENIKTKQFNLSEIDTSDLFAYLCRKYLQSCREFVQIIEKLQNNETESIEYDLVYNDRISSTLLYELFLKQFSSFFYFNFANSTCDIKSFIEVKEISTKHMYKIKKNIIFPKRESINIMQSFFIYTDIIHDSSVCNRNEAILKIIKPESNFGEYVHKNFARPDYHRINKTLINKIYICIKDENNNFVNFKRGPLIIKLHFRKIKK